MNDNEAALTDAFPLVEATDWIGRWKDAGGGFFPRVIGDQLQVQLAFRSESGALSEEATALQTELLIDPRLKSAVTTLVASAWEKARIAAQPPAGHA